MLSSSESGASAAGARAGAALLGHELDRVSRQFGRDRARGSRRRARQGGSGKLLLRRSSQRKARPGRPVRGRCGGGAEGIRCGRGVDALAGRRRAVHTGKSIRKSIARIKIEIEIHDAFVCAALYQLELNDLRTAFTSWLRELIRRKG